MNYFINHPISMFVTGRIDPVTVTPFNGVADLWKHGTLIPGGTVLRDEKIIWLAELLMAHPDVFFVGDFHNFDKLHWNGGQNPNTQSLVEFSLVNDYLEPSLQHYFNAVLKHETYLTVRNIAYSGADLIIYHMRGNRRYMGVDRAVRHSMIDTFLADNE